jgi:hypothetical protein
LKPIQQLVRRYIWRGHAPAMVMKLTCFFQGIVQAAQAELSRRGEVSEQIAHFGNGEHLLQT